LDHVLGSEDIVASPFTLHKGLLIVLPTLSNEVLSAAYIEEELKTKSLKARHSLFYRAEIATGGSSAAGN